MDEKEKTEYWQLEKEFLFEAAHMLPNHDGKCARLHGHSWKGRVVIQGDGLYINGPKQGMVMDYSDISAKIKPMNEKYLDHHYLNETLGLSAPTSEEVARWVYNHLKQELPELHQVIIEETCTSRCTYGR
jgi:6-pyruvoyltetrahydropterin/6-carboxytetrahydropterin synthase